jgi:hypothetical protein
MFRRIFLSCLFCSSLFSESFVTYEFSGGRLGDCLLSYLHAKWLSYTYDVPLLYRPFPYSSELALHIKEKRYQPFYLINYPMIKLHSERPVPQMDGYIYECPYFPTRPDNEWEDPATYRFSIDWKDEEFKKIARELIAPLKPLLVTRPPENCVNIAIHIREGGGFEKGLFHFPLKLPPFSFYLEGFLKVLAQFEGLPVYCYLFTDALEPGKLAEQLEKVVPEGARVRIDYRRENNHHAANVLEDFFSFFYFDALIYPNSNYSGVPAAMGDFAVTYFPLEFTRMKKKVIITKSHLEKNELFYQKVQTRVSKQ